jgi:hypothetical protein
VNDGWKPLTPAEFAAKLQPKPIVDHPLERALTHVDALRRQLLFVANPGFVEFQALGVRRAYSDSHDRVRAIHVQTPEAARNACMEADGWIAHGIYILSNALKPGVESRHQAPGSWYELPKGGTTDNDVATRLILAIDFDAVRPSGTSASDAEMHRSAQVALRAWSYLEGAFGDSTSMAYVHSGNGRQIHLALDSLPNDDESKCFANAVLIGLATLFDSPEVKVDRKLGDAKRILPACGTIKKKGAPGIPDRPHRRTAIVTPDTVKRLSLDDIKKLCRIIWDDTTDEGRAEMGKAVGIAAPAVQTLSPQADSPFARANSIAPLEVAEWLGVYDGKKSTCPGCGESKGVAVLNHGLKCSHDRCHGRGRNGFRTNVDLVAEVRSVSPRDAVNELAERFGFEGLKREAPPPPPPNDSSGFQWISTAEIFDPLPPTKWLVQDLQLVAGRPTMLAGYGFSGKTLMAQALAIALASGAPVWGKFNPGAAHSVRHLDYEQGRHATLKRYQRIAIGHGISKDSIGDRLHVAIFPDVYLDSAGAQDAYCKAVEGVPFVMLDALRGATPTIDENDSTIRRCLDNLSRVSEKTGTAFLILHHAGKVGAADGDARKTPRGSSAIFDACGCVFSIEGEDKKPKRIQQTKAPAEAEGGAIPEFFVSIEDVPSPENPTAGLRVVCPDATVARAHTGASAKVDALKVFILELIASTPGLNPTAAANRTGVRKQFALDVIGELLSEGRLSQPGGTGTPLVPGSGGSQSVPDRVGNRFPGSPPLKGEPGSGTEGHGNRQREDGDAKRRHQAQEDVAVLIGVPVKERSQYMAAQGWSDERARRARGVLSLRETSLKKDTEALQKVAGDVDPAAWATEQGWTDERIREALAGVTIPREYINGNGKLQQAGPEELQAAVVEFVTTYPKITMGTLESAMVKRFGMIDLEPVVYAALEAGVIKNLVIRGGRCFVLGDKT